MARLDVGDDFSVHDHRTELKLLERTAETVHLDNREGLACPACDREFDRLFVSEKRHNTFESPPGPFCLVRAGETLLVLTH
ncbi:MAG: flagella cluster protein [Halolamina sp.]